MDAVRAISVQHRLPVVEDAAEAHGATYQGRQAGSMGTAGTFSFFGNKIVTTGEGGMVTLNDPQLAARIRLLRNHAATGDHRHWHSAVGFNYRMTNLQAAVGVAQMERIAEFLAGRATVAAWYSEEFVGLEGIVQRPEPTTGSRHVYWMYPIILSPQLAIDCRALINQLRHDGIDTRPVFAPLYLMEPYRDHQAACPVAEDVSARGVCLPAYPRLGRGQVAHIAARLRFHLGLSRGSTRSSAVRHG
jgi:perosamine synthetase